MRLRVIREMKQQLLVHYSELAAMNGCPTARFNVGANEGSLGNIDGALKHWMIAARDGECKSLKNIKLMYENGGATKDDYAKALCLSNISRRDQE